ncbi:hypothetical protein RR11_3405 [Ruegeria sp. R11]|nr:hypothetical protein RR11_3405 [Ruegeria sp. R11]
MGAPPISQVACAFRCFCAGDLLQISDQKPTIPIVPPVIDS